MKKIIFFCVSLLAFGCFNAQAQFIGVDNVNIPLYEDSVCTTPIATIYQDTLKEQYYKVEIIGESKNRFKVIIGSDWSYSDFGLKTWIDKDYVAVCNWPSQSLDQSVYLFALPDKNSDKQIIHADEITEWKSLLVSVKDSWFKIVVKTKSGLQEGWTWNYCPNIWGSCEGGASY